jgi:flagellar motility protein MotE (MotC chaperone)
MARTFQFLGIAMAAYLGFVGLLHGVLAARGRYTKESLGAFHDWPLIGGFFPKAPPAAPPVSPAERREQRAIDWLADSRNEFRLPAPFTTEDVEALVRELKDARTAADAARALHEAGLTDVARVRKDLDAQQQALNATADVLEQKSRELAASRDELDHYRTYVRTEEIRNTKTLADMYGAMPAEDAATKLGELDDDVVAKVIARMSERKAGRILAAMDTPRAVAITKKLQALVADATEATRK